MIHREANTELGVNFSSKIWPELRSELDTELSPELWSELSWELYSELKMLYDNIQR